MGSIEDLRGELLKKMGEGMEGKEGMEGMEGKEGKGEEGLGKEFEGDGIEEILNEASEEFNVGQEKLDYEVLRYSKKGILGIGRVKYKLKVWVVNDGGVGGEEVLGGEEGVGVDEEKKEVKKVDISVRKSGVYVQVLEAGLNLKNVRFELAGRNITNYDGGLVEEALRLVGEEVKVGEWEGDNELYDSQGSCEVSSDGMECWIRIRKPILSGRELEEEEVYELLRESEVVYGVDKERVKEILRDKIYNRRVLVGRGDLPKHGEDGKINYKINIDEKVQNLKEKESGQVDHKDLNLVENVIAGQILAQRIPFKKGVAGKNVYGEVLEARDGNDIKLECGRNTILSEDGLELISQIVGRPMYRMGVISVDPVYEVKGDVGAVTGNIVFLGLVVVLGNVNDGYEVKAAEGVDVRGTVGKSNIESDRNVVVGQGILGKGEGVVRAGGDVVAKFIENANVYAGGDVIVKEEILHSYVEVVGRVICLGGKKGTILGGSLIVGQEINAKYLGASAYTKTELETGVDPKYRAKLIELEGEKKENEEQLSKINMNILTLNRMKAGGGMNEDKGKMLERFELAKKNIELNYQDIIEDIEELKNYLENLDIDGKVSAKLNVYPGVEIKIKGAVLVVKNDFKGVTFVNEKNFIKSLPYQKIDGID